MARIEADLPSGDLLFKPLLHGQVVDIVRLIGCVKHFGGVVAVFLLSRAHVHADVGVAKSIVLELYREVLSVKYSLKNIVKVALVSVCV